MLTGMARRLVLISTSTVFGTRYLEHAFAELRDALGGVGAGALHPPRPPGPGRLRREGARRFAEMGFGLDSLHEAADPRRAVEKAEAIFCGGGNTFRLLAALQELDVLPRSAAAWPRACPTPGASAGSNLACPTIRTTNDMPIVQPATFDALGLVAFQINPHYLDPDPARPTWARRGRRASASSTRRTRRRSSACARGRSCGSRGRRSCSSGVAGARLFRRGEEPVEVAPVAAIEALVDRLRPRRAPGPSATVAFRAEPCRSSSDP